MTKKSSKYAQPESATNDDDSTNLVHLTKNFKDDDLAVGFQNTFTMFIIHLKISTVPK